MKAWSAALAGEIAVWPQVSTCAFFGFTALYHGDKIFAALPRTRGWESAQSLAFKLQTSASDVPVRLQKDSRIRVWSGSGQKARWFAFELSCDADLHDALEWLGLAYEGSRKTKKLR